MSNDLIGKKLVYADDIYRYIKAEINPYGKPFEGSAYEFGLKIMEHIENISSAYDVDKVVELLEERLCSETDAAMDVSCAMRNNHFKESIEIVKAGYVS